MSKIYCPIYYQVYYREGTKWYFQSGKTFYNPNAIATDLESVLARHDLTRAKIQIEFFRLNGGKSGYYVLNLRDKKYYYCGTDWEDVKTTMLGLGIGQKDPS